jgi:hypothetical protein
MIKSARIGSNHDRFGCDGESRNGIDIVIAIAIIVPLKSYLSQNPNLDARRYNSNLEPDIRTSTGKTRQPRNRLGILGNG